MIERVYKNEIDELPQNTILEELRIWYEVDGEIRQQVIPFAVITNKKIFRASKEGKILAEEKFKNIRKLSFIERYP